MTTMTTDQCFDQMATALGMGGDRGVEDVGYIAILEEVKKLKEDLDASAIALDIVKAENEINKKNMLRFIEENKKLKQDVLKKDKLEMDNSILRDLLQNRMPTGCIAETTYQPILDENEKMQDQKDDLLDMMDRIQTWCGVMGEGDLNTFHEITANKMKEGGEFENL